MGFCLCSEYISDLKKDLPKACNFIKKEILAQVFSCEFCEISKNTFSTEHLRTTASVYHLCYVGYTNQALKSLFWDSLFCLLSKYSLAKCPSL